MANKHTHMANKHTHGKKHTMANKHTHMTNNHTHDGTLWHIRQINTHLREMPTVRGIKGIPLKMMTWLKMPTVRGIKRQPLGE